MTEGDKPVFDVMHFFPQVTVCLLMLIVEVACLEKLLLRSRKECLQPSQEGNVGSRNQRHYVAKMGQKEPFDI